MELLDFVSASQFQSARSLLSGYFLTNELLGSFDVADLLPPEGAEFGSEVSVLPVRGALTTPVHLVVDPSVKAATTVSEPIEDDLTNPQDWLDHSRWGRSWYAATEKLYDILVLEDGWDGPQSKRISLKTVVSAQLLIERLAESMLAGPVPMVGADAEGAVVLTWDEAAVTASLSVFDDGTYYYYAENQERSASGGCGVVDAPIPLDLVSILSVMQ